MSKSNQYSPQLSQYLGNVELRASRIEDSYDRYACFRDALRSVSEAGLTESDLRLAINVLEKRIKETEPSNIGWASGELGDAD